MFFSLQFVEDHPIYQVHQLFRDFFEVCASDDEFSPEAFPKWYQRLLADSAIVRSHVEAISVIVKMQDAAARSRILEVFDNNNLIQELCENAELARHELEDVVVELDGNQVSLKKRIELLFTTLYKSVLGKTRLFDEADDYSNFNTHHEAFRKVNGKVCPFCCMATYADMRADYNPQNDEYRDITVKRPAYDHYLSKDSYPFAAVNFRNLIPICDECNNAPNKGRKDILFENGLRRRAFYPFVPATNVTLSVANDEWSIENRQGTWTAQVATAVEEDAEKITTWNAVFNITSRIQNRVRGHNRTWLIQCMYGVGDTDLDGLRQIFRGEAEKHGLLVRSAADSLIKQAFFEYLSSAPDNLLDGLRSTMEFMRGFDNSADAVA